MDKVSLTSCVTLYFYDIFADPDVDPIAADSGPLELENKEETEECIIPDDESRIVSILIKLS